MPKGDEEYWYRVALQIAGYQAATAEYSCSLNSTSKSEKIRQVRISEKIKALLEMEEPPDIQTSSFASEEHLFVVNRLYGVITLYKDHPDRGGLRDLDEE